MSKRGGNFLTVPFAFCLLAGRRAGPFGPELRDFQDFVKRAQGLREAVITFQVQSLGASMLSINTWSGRRLTLPPSGRVGLLTSQVVLSSTPLTMLYNALANAVQVWAPCSDYLGKLTLMVRLYWRVTMQPPLHVIWPLPSPSPCLLRWPCELKYPVVQYVLHAY